MMNRRGRGVSWGFLGCAVWCFCRPAGACLLSRASPPLTRWAAFFRSFGAGFHWCCCGWRAQIVHHRGHRGTQRVCGLRRHLLCLTRLGLTGLTKLGIGGGPLVHGPTVAHLKSTVKVGCHKTKINICGKSWGGGGWERVVWVAVSGGSVGDSRNGNGSWSLVLQGVRRFPQEQS